MVLNRTGRSRCPVGQRRSAPHTQYSPSTDYRRRGGALGSTGNVAWIHTKRRGRFRLERTTLMRSARTIQELTVAGALEAPPSPPSAPRATCPCRNQTLLNTTLPTLKNYASTPLHFSAISGVFHDWATARRDRVPDSAAHGSGLDSGGPLGCVCAQPMEDRSKNPACLEGVTGVSRKCCASCRALTRSDQRRNAE